MGADETLLRDIADGKPIEHARILALVDAVLSADLVGAAMSAHTAEPRFLHHHAIEPAALIMQEDASDTAETEPSVG